MSTIKMGQKINKFWAFMFYCFLKFELKSRNVYRYLNPFNWTARGGSFKENDFKGNAKIEFKNKFLNDKAISETWAQIYVSAYLAIIVCTVFNIIGGQKIWSYILKERGYEVIFIIILIFICYRINNFSLFQNGKYLIYFEEFENLSHAKKRLYGLISFIFLILTILAFFYSLKCEGLGAVQTG